MRAQHRPAMNVLGQRLVVGRESSLRRTRSSYLRQERDVGIAQNQATIRMGDQAALSINNIGLSAVVNPRLRYHIPDESKIDLRNDDTVILAIARHCERHVWFRFTQEIDRAIVSLLCSRLGEQRILGKVDLASSDVLG